VGRGHANKQVGRTLRALRVDAPAKLIAKKSEARAAKEKRRDQLQQMAREIVEKVPACIDRYITESAAEQARAESDLAEKEARLEEVNAAFGRLASELSKHKIKEAKLQVVIHRSHA